MKVSKHFTAAEMLSDKLLAKIKSKGQNPMRYINPKMIEVNESVRHLLNVIVPQHIDGVVSVSLTGNKAGVQTRGKRSEFDKTKGAELSDHKFGNAQDVDVNYHYADGSKKEADYEELQALIQAYDTDFFSIGITMIEDVAYAPTWFHYSIAWTGLDKLKIIKP
tara:strand:- start:4703 stop:5194 length:492 start_codon:yes stop_codon:yes gene_type:complete